MELPIATVLIGLLLGLAYLSPTLVAGLFLGVSALGGYAMAMALLARRDR